MKYARLSFTFIKSLLNKVETVEAKPDPNHITSRSTNIAEVNISVTIFLFYLKTSRQIILYEKQEVKGTLEICKFSFAKMHKVVFVSFLIVLKTLFVKVGAESSKVIGWTGGPVSY